jgi:ribonuclease E
MTDSEPSNHWDSLADQLGAGPAPPEPHQEAASKDPHEADADTAETAKTDESSAISSLPPSSGSDDSERASRGHPKPAPRRTEKRSPRHWASLAGQLGLEVPEEAVDEAEPQAESPPEPEDAAPVLGSTEESTTAADDAPPSAWSDTAMTADADSLPAIDRELSGSQTARQAASLDFGFGIIDADDTRDQSFIEEAKEAVSDVTEDEEDESYEPAPWEVETAATHEDETPAAGDAGIQRDVTETVPTDDKTKRRKRRRGRRRRPRDEQGDERIEPAAGDIADASQAGPQSVSEPADTGSGTEGPSRKRRRPRRRPIVGMPDIGPSSEVGADEAASTQPDQAASTQPEEMQPVAGPPRESAADTDTAPKPERRRQKGQRQHETTSDSSGRADSGRPSHRKIPSWEEAIGLVISANEQARAKAAESGGRRRGRGKGRRSSRGGKKN